MSEKKSQNIFKHLYRSISGQALGMAVKPQQIGEIPNHQPDTDTLTFYVLKEYSRSNSILIDLQTKEYQLPPALMKVQHATYQLDENAGIIFLHHPNARHKHSVSPRLLRLITATRQYPNLTVRLIPVTIIWGRSPDKEDSLFKLLVADNWREPSISKQLFNIGVMGRDTFVQFHKPKYLADLIDGAALSAQSSLKPSLNPSQPTQTRALITTADAHHSLAISVQQQLNVFLDKKRASILGPDLSDKRNVVDKLLYSPAIKAAITQESETSNQSRAVVKQQAREYLNEIASDYAYPVVRFFDNFLTWLWTQLYDGIEVQHFERLRELATDCEIVYVPSHRSHIDYLLLSYVIYKRGLMVPYIAAGKNLNLPILGQILRSGGAFFMRRTFKDNPLYTAVFKEYLHSIIQRNTPIEYFIEGGRSRSGRLLPPKLGMISMTVQSHLRKASKPIVFIPTYIGYERIMEGGTYVGELKGKPKESETLIGVLKTSRKIERIFGTVHVSFGTPLHLNDFMEKFEVAENCLPQHTTDAELTDNINDMIENIGVKVLQHINKAAVINPVSLLSLVLLSTPKGALTEDSCGEQIALYQRIAKQSIYDDDITITNMSPQQVIDYGVKLKLIERRGHLLGDIVQICHGQAALLSYFRNNILHTFIVLSFLAALVERNGRIKRVRLDSIVEQLYPFLQAELFLKFSQRSLKKVIDQKLNCLIKEGLIIDLGDGVLGTPKSNSSAYQQLQVLANLVQQSLERYILTLALMAQQGSGHLTAEQVVDLCHLLGQRLSILYANDIPDFFDRALFKSFIKALVRLGYIVKEDGTGILNFDHRIHDIAHYARYILHPDVLQILQHMAEIDDANIQDVIDELNAKKSRKFRRKG